MAGKRKIIHIDETLCNGCGQCVAVCAEGALAIIDGNARVRSDSFCDGLGACIGICPQGALRIIECESAAFDEHAAAEHVRDKVRAHDAAHLAQQCPSARLRWLSSGKQTKESVSHTYQPVSAESSALMNWPVKIKLVSPDAMFLQTADLMIVSDCVPFAYAALHRDFLKDRVVLTGCPKFDDVTLYIRKFADILKHGSIRSITVLVMEVPCCQAMPRIVEQGMRSAGLIIPLKTVVVGMEGEVLKAVNSQW